MSATTKADNAAGGLGRWLMVGGIVVAAGVLSSLYAINEYASGTAVLEQDANTNAGRFESVYRESTDSRLTMLTLGLDILLQDDAIRTHFAAGNRDALAKIVVPLYLERLKPRYDLEQLNFFTPPAIVYLRADDPKIFGNDLSGVRRSILLAGERRQMVAGMETGLGGTVALRAVAPIFDGAKLVGTMGVGDGIIDHLKKAAEVSGMQFALGLDRAIAEKSERNPDPKNDAIQGKDIFTTYSSTQVGQVLRAVEFDPRAYKSQLTDVHGRMVFLKTFPLNNISGVPSVVIATMLDLTDAFAEVRMSAAIKGIILFLLISVVGSVGVTRFRAMQQSLQKALLGQRKELEDKTAALQAAQAKLKDVEALKRSFLNNLVTALSEPLQAVSGQLQAVGPSVENVLRGSADAGDRGQIIGQLRQAVWKTTRASRSIGDYQQLELFRQGLVKVDTPLVNLAQVVQQVLEEDVVATARLSGLDIAADVPGNLPRTRVDAGLLRRALAGLIHAMGESGASGRLILSAAVDADAWLAIRMGGASFPQGQAPAAAMVDGARTFLAQFKTNPGIPSEGEVSLGLALSLSIVEFFGGRLTALPGDDGQAGYLVQLPAVR